jgi:hypothetical protein
MLTSTSVRILCKLIRGRIIKNDIENHHKFMMIFKGRYRMLVKPNKTVLFGKVNAIRPEPDGLGAEIEVEVSENNSPIEDEDFLKVKPGDVMKLYSTEPEKLNVGDNIQGQASLLAGPFGGRAILESVRKLKN